MIIYTAGLSKTGKTSRCLHTAKQIKSIEYISVSNLLRETGISFPVITVESGVKNQYEAVKALRNFSKQKLHQLIDGHTLIETLEGPVLVPDWFFEQVTPDVIVYIKEAPADIIARRGLVESSIREKEIEALQNIAFVACQRIGLLFKIDVKLLESPSFESFTSEIHDCLLN